MSKKKQQQLTPEDLQFIESTLKDFAIGTFFNVDDETFFGNSHHHSLLNEESTQQKEPHDLLYRPSILSEEKIQRVREELEHYKQNLEKAESRFESLRVNFQNLSKINGELTTELNGLKEQRTKQSETIAGLMKEIEMLNFSFTELEDELLKSGKENEQLNDVAQKLQTEVHELKGALNELTVQYNKCLKEKDVLVDSKGETAQREQTLLQKNIQLSENIEKLNEQLADALWDAALVDLALNEKKQVEQQLATLLTQNESWKESYAQLGKMYDTIETKLTTMKEEKEKLEVEYEKLSELYTDVFSEALDLDEQLNKSKADNRRLSNDYAHLSNTSHQQTIDNANKDRTIKDLESLVEDQTACHVISTQTIERLDVNVANLQKSLEKEKEATNFYIQLILEVLDKDVEKIIVTKTNETRLMLLKAASDVIHKIPHEVSVFETPEMESKGFKIIEKNESIEELPTTTTTTNKNLVRLWLFVFVIVGLLGYATLQF